ncbi:hypothetical protein HQ346_08495 [Rhodococcus sp. BP-252]|uniref:Low molecular weight antigen MTB12-like C-terminal domain-containing protein n=1 Tax=Rhodococcoides kyotonense TaxID=398843 RepID=A0A177YQE3_9NOCA|nr:MULTISPECIES: hypothetical protein [Rhodococcus]MBY6411339.1 hypothetical protein [Rhodococcus sp. BP-320]MBY6415998.1 hypothetical protein [Rhodococcus sp. BP-321]MBY6420493.1 hypothetical protein [Rhodococcus sp. BP-324]MBY6426205.1 hypothetical protein [Rhodococcus sp. BP-323]MBY6431254.1 hypothetical protein [Rhodococcus sp. BP-322]
MKLRNTRRALVAGVAIAATLTMTACSSGDDEGGNDATTSASVASTTATTEAQSDYPPVPTAEELNQELARGLDPAVPVEEKAQLIQGAEADPELINQVAAAAVQNGAEIVITSVDDLGDGTLNAGATLTIGGQANPGNFTFVAEDGVWKLSKENACSFVQLAQLTSPACA